MITSDNLPSILAAIAWPFVVLIFVLLFKKKIDKLINRLQQATLPGGAGLAFGEATIDKAAQQPSLKAKTQSVLEAEQSQADSIKWSNSGNLFWASHDLMLTIDRLLRGSPKDQIVFTLQQSLWHVRSLGFRGSPIEYKLTQLTARAAATLPTDWTKQLRDDYAAGLETIKNAIGELAADSQPDFQPGPKTSELVLGMEDILATYSTLSPL